jgi:hypothetical protein
VATVVNLKEIAVGSALQGALDREELYAKFGWVEFLPFEAEHAFHAAELEAAITEALARGVPHPNAVRLALERRRELRGAPPPLPIRLPEPVQARDPVIRPHALADYDRLSSKEPTDESV